MARVVNRSPGAWLLALLLVLPATAAATTLSGTGYGSTRAEAGDDALTALASNIFVQLESTSESYYNDRGENYFETSTLATTRLPLLGVTTDCAVSDGQHVCSAQMDRNRSLALYRQAAAEAEETIRAELEGLEGRDDAERYRILSDLVVTYDQLDKYRTVITFLSGESQATVRLPRTLTDVRRELARLRARAPTISVAVENLLDDFDSGQAVAPKAPLPRGSREVTPFGRAVQAELERQLGERVSRESDAPELIGQYTVEDDGLSLSYSLVDGDGNTLRTSVARLAPAAYADHPVEPAMVDFDQLLHNGYAVSADFQVQVTTNRGSRGIHFADGEIIELMVRLNRPGYFYIVGHTQNDEREMSYLIDLHSAPGPQRFIQYVNIDQVNRWISLGRFAVQPPFGTESLQVVASEEDPVRDLPPHRYDQSSGYYIVADDTVEGVEQVRTRSLQRVRETESASAEAVLMFSTAGGD